MPLSLLILVAAIQGLTEFLPVSSSGHLMLIPILTDFAYQGRVIDVAAHVGTLIAVVLYLRSEIIDITAALLNFGRKDKDNAKLGLVLVLGTIPVIIAGYFVNYASWHWLELAQTLAIANLVFACVLWIADKTPIKHHRLEMVSAQTAIIVGIFQVFALIPGASRSGVTMSAARFLGYDRLTAARFSLLLSLPAIAGAGLLKSVDLLKSGDAALGIDAIIVVIFSASLAWIAIYWMMSWLSSSSFTIFIYYRFALGGLVLLALGQGWLPLTIS
ncbi:undecaprenyl-diphosphate phosphatase [Candidatus Puniceispirillum sp.]|nr:undecaprenyl-diphosphate phosphatase [Candidatus Puniceispirillum sp.]